MKIQIDSTEVSERGGTDRNGKPYRIRTQAAYVDMGKRYPAEVKLRLKDDARAFQPGDYEVVLEKSVYVSKYGSLALSEELVLMPAAKLAAKAA